MGHHAAIWWWHNLKEVLNTVFYLSYELVYKNVVDGSACRLFRADFLLGLLFDTEDGGRIVLWNTLGFLSDYIRKTALVTV
jgi:hypothetical protein